MATFINYHSHWNFDSDGNMVQVANRVFGSSDDCPDCTSLASREDAFRRWLDHDVTVSSHLSHLVIGVDGKRPIMAQSNTLWDYSGINDPEWNDVYIYPLDDQEVMDYLYGW